MKLLVIFSVLASVLLVAESREYFRDERGRTYVIGVYGERIYEDADGNMIEKTKKTRAVDVNSDVMTNFGWSLFQNSRSKDEASPNFVISSLGPQLLLSLIAKETKADTLKEIRTAIGNDGNKKIGKMIKSMIVDESNRELDIATAMFINSDNANSLKQSYALEGNKSSVTVRSWDFKNAKRVQEKYDHWLREHTNGILQSEPLAIDRDTKMILSSTIYFKGSWIFEFTPAEKPISFQVKSEQDKFPVEAIKSVFKKYHYGYLNDDNGEWLSIPYNSTEALLILLPNKTKNFQIDDFIKATPASDITDIIDIINDRSEPNTLVNITMPRFKIASSADLKTSLKKMGISKIFERDAEFYPLEGNQPMQVSSATQQSSLEVNEEGSVGASVSKFSVVALSIKAPVKQVDFVVDRPYVAVVVNRLYRVPYFIAKVSDPRDF